MGTPSTSRGITGILGAVLAGMASAALFTVAWLHAETVLMFFFAIVIMPLFLAGFGAGSLAGLMASFAGAGSLFLTQPSNFAVIYAFLYAVPAIILTTLALRYRVGTDQKIYWYPEGLLLTAITLYPCVLFLAVSAIMSSYPGGLHGLTLEMFNTLIDEAGKQFDATGKSLTADQLAAMHVGITRTAKIAPAMACYMWIVITVLCMAMTQFVLQQQKWNLRGGFVLRNIHVPSWLIYAVALTGLAGALTPEPYDYIGINLAMILGLPFFFVGLAVVHSWAATTRTPVLVLVAFYVVLALMTWMALLVAALGVADQWADFRLRLAKRKQA